MTLDNNSARAINPGARVRVAGFGKTVGTIAAPDTNRYVRARTGEEFFAGSRRLLETSIETISQSQCRAHHTDANISNGHICAGHVQGGQDSCGGDSGGPLVAYDDGACPYQIGVVSWGDPVCGGTRTSQAAYGVYTRVAQFGDWIQKHTGALTDATPAATANSNGRLSKTELLEGIAQLKTLLGPVSGKISIDIDNANNNRVRLGRTLAFSVRSDISGKLALIDINANHEVLLIFPNKYVSAGPAELIHADTPLRVPGRGYGFTAFRAVEPIGRSRMIALVIPDNFKIERFLVPSDGRSKGFQPVNEPTSYFMRFIRQIERYLTTTRSNGRQPLHGWAFGLVDYEITR